MSHGVGKWALKKLLGSDVSPFGPQFKMSRNVGERLVKVRHRRTKVWQGRRTVAAADKQRARISHEAIHVAYQFVWRADVRSRPKVCEIWRRVTKRFLGPVGERGQEMP